MSPAQRTRLLIALSTSAVPQLRSGFHALKRLSSFMFYSVTDERGESRVWPRIHYEPSNLPPPSPWPNCSLSRSRVTISRSTQTCASSDRAPVAVSPPRSWRRAVSKSSCWKPAPAIRPRTSTSRVARHVAPVPGHRSHGDTRSERRYSCRGLHRRRKSAVNSADLAAHPGQRPRRMGRVVRVLRLHRRALFARDGRRRRPALACRPMRVPSTPTTRTIRARLRRARLRIVPYRQELGGVRSRPVRILHLRLSSSARSDRPPITYLCATRSASGNTTILACCRAHRDHHRGHGRATGVIADRDATTPVRTIRVTVRAPTRRSSRRAGFRVPRCLQRSATRAAGRSDATCFLHPTTAAIGTVRRSRRTVEWSAAD